MWIHISSFNLVFYASNFQEGQIQKNTLYVYSYLHLYLYLHKYLYFIAFGIDGSIWETKEDPRTISLPSLPLFTPVSNSHPAGRPLDQNLNQQFYLCP